MVLSFVVFVYDTIVLVIIVGAIMAVRRILAPRVELLLASGGFAVR